MNSLIKETWLRQVAAESDPPKHRGNVKWFITKCKHAKGGTVANYFGHISSPHYEFMTDISRWAFLDRQIFLPAAKPRRSMDDILVVGGGGGVEVVFFLLGKFCENNCRLREAILELCKTDKFNEHLLSWGQMWPLRLFGGHHGSEAIKLAVGGNIHMDARPGNHGC